MKVISLFVGIVITTERDEEIYVNRDLTNSHTGGTLVHLESHGTSQFTSSK